MLQATKPAHKKRRRWRKSVPVREIRRPIDTASPGSNPNEPKQQHSGNKRCPIATTYRETQADNGNRILSAATFHIGHRERIFTGSGNTPGRTCRSVIPQITQAGRSLHPDQDWIPGAKNSIRRQYQLWVSAHPDDQTGRVEATCLVQYMSHQVIPRTWKNDIGRFGALKSIRICICKRPHGNPSSQGFTLKFKRFIAASRRVAGQNRGVEHRKRQAKIVHRNCLRLLRGGTRYDPGDIEGAPVGRRQRGKKSIPCGHTANRACRAIIQQCPRIRFGQNKGTLVARCRSGRRPANPPSCVVIISFPEDSAVGMKCVSQGCHSDRNGSSSAALQKKTPGKK